MPLGKDDVVFLESMDTPTVCNVIEIVAPERRGHGYTTRHLHCAFPDLPPKVGFAKTVTMRAKDPVPLGGEGYMQTRTGRKNPGRHDTQRLPSSEMPPPGTIMCTCG